MWTQRCYLRSAVLIQHIDYDDTHKQNGYTNDTHEPGISNDDTHNQNGHNDDYQDQYINKF